MKVGVLWFPGWTATDSDLYEMIQYLSKNGIEYYSINLKGHNTKPSDLHGISYREWLKQAEQAYLEISEKWDCIFVGGLSTGGHLALYLASKYKVSGVITIGTPLDLKTHWFIKLCSPILKYIPYQIAKQNTFPNDRIRDISLSRKGSYTSFPISSAVQVYILTKEIRKKFVNKVKQPILLIQSTTDHLLPSYNLDLFKSKLQTPAQDIKIMWVKNSYHLVNLDHSKLQVFKTIYEFIQKYSIIKKYK
jgi:carboxylesterase